MSDATQIVEPELNEVQRLTMREVERSHGYLDVCVLPTKTKEDEGTNEITISMIKERNQSKISHRRKVTKGRVWSRRIEKVRDRVSHVSVGMAVGGSLGDAVVVWRCRDLTRHGTRMTLRYFDFGSLVHSAAADAGRYLIGTWGHKGRFAVFGV